MKKRATTKTDLATIKVTRESVKNFNIVAGLSGKNQYEVVEEASVIARKKYLLKTKTN